MKVTSGSSPTKVFSTLAAEPSATIAGAATTGLDPASDAAKELSGVLGMLASGAAFGSGGSTDDPFAGTLTTAISGIVTPILTAKQLSVAFTGVGADHTPGLLINVQERDAATASSLTDSINQLVGGAAPAGRFKVTQNGSSVNATIGAPVLGGSLGSSALFKTTMAGMSGATGAGYFDVQRVIASSGSDLSAADRQAWAPVKSIGFSVTSGGATADMLVRVIIK
jgi:hypothetical protein